jgi:hypothetical protein
VNYYLLAPEKKNSLSPSFAVLFFPPFFLAGDVVMRVLVYKRTHNGDPDRNGCFGAEDCMGTVRTRRFDAVIGVGGIGSEAFSNGIAGQINWIGIGPHKTTKRGYRGPIVTFDHFLDFGKEGPDFQDLAPTLAERMYANNIRHVMDGLREEEYQEVLNILRLAEEEPPSPERAASRVQTGKVKRCKASRRFKRCGAGPTSEPYR